MNTDCKFISEVSSNHNNNKQRIEKFIKISKLSGFYAVKFQLFKIDKLFTNEVLYNSKQHRERSKWELKEQYIPFIRQTCDKYKIKFGCTPFYLEAVDILKPYVDFYKISSYELLWLDLIKKCAETKKKIIISTGMSNMKEVKEAVNVCRKVGNKNIILLHCTSSYPSKPKESNLSVIKKMKDEFQCKVGLSDHSVNKTVLRRAIHKWESEYIELHLDIDKKGEEYKFGHCWLPEQISPIIKEFNNISILDGNSKKQFTKSEKKEKYWRADPIDGLRPLKKIRNSIKDILNEKN